MTSQAEVIKSQVESMLQQSCGEMRIVTELIGNTAYFTMISENGSLIRNEVVFVDKLILVGHYGLLGSKYFGVVSDYIAADNADEIVAILRDLSWVDSIRRNTIVSSKLSPFYQSGVTTDQLKSGMREYDKHEELAGVINQAILDNQTEEADEMRDSIVKTIHEEIGYDLEVYWRQQSKVGYELYFNAAPTSVVMDIYGDTYSVASMYI